MSTHNTVFIEKYTKLSLHYYQLTPYLVFNLNICPENRKTSFLATGLIKYEPHHVNTCFLHMQKHIHRSAVW